jgi:hypothetical protein
MEDVERTRTKGFQVAAGFVHRGGAVPSFPSTRGLNPGGTRFDVHAPSVKTRLWFDVRFEDF